MSVVGTWLVDFDWGLDGTWEVITLEFAADGTWTSVGYPQDDPPHWTEMDGLVLMSSIPPDGAHTVFAAHRVDDSMVGISSNTAGTFRGRVAGPPHAERSGFAPRRGCRCKGRTVPGSEPAGITAPGATQPRIFRPRATPQQWEMGTTFRGRFLHW